MRWRMPDHERFIPVISAAIVISVTQKQARQIASIETIASSDESLVNRVNWYLPQEESVQQSR